MAKMCPKMLKTGEKRPFSFLQRPLRLGCACEGIYCYFLHIMNFNTKILCIGAGYVGGPTMTVIADK